MLSCSLSLCLGQSSFLMTPRPSTSIDMGSRWLLLLLLLLSRDRVFNLPSSASVWVLASHSSSTNDPVLNKNPSCPSTSSSMPQNMKGHDSTEKPNSSSVTETSTSKTQDQMTSSTLPTLPQSRSTAGPTEKMTSKVHTPVVTITTSMSLSDSLVTSTVKESIGTSKTTVLFSSATSTETTRLNQTPTSESSDKVGDTNKPLPVTTMAVTSTSSPTTAIPRATVLSTATAETQEKDTTAEPPTLGTISTTSKPPDTHQSTVTQTHSQPAQVTSDVSMTLGTTPSATKFRSSVSPSLRDTDRTVMTPSMTLVLSSLEHASPSSQTGTPTVPEKLTSTLPSSTLDKVDDTNKPLPVTTMAVTNTSSPTTAIPRTTVLSTATAETQEKDTTAEPPTLGTISTTSKPPDTHQSTVTQTHSQPAQVTSDVSMTLGTTPSATKFTNTGLVSSVSPNLRDTDRTVMTPSMTLVLSTPEHASPSSQTGTPTVPEKSTSTLPSSTLDKVGDTNKPLPVTTMAVTNTSSPTTAIPRTTVLSTAIAETQEKDTTAELPTLGTISTTSKPPDTHQSTVTQTHSQPAQVTSDVSMTLGTTPSATKFTNTGLVSSVSPSLGDTARTVMTPSTTLVLSTPEHASPSSQTGTPTVPEKSTSTLPSSTLDKVDDTNKPLPVTTMAVTNTSSPTTAIPRTTVLSIVIAETQEKDTTAEPPTLGTISTTSKPPDTHQSTVTQTHSQPAQVTSDVSMTLGTTPSATKFTNTGLVSSVSPNLRDTDRTVMTPSTTLVLSTPEHASPSSQTGTPTVPEKSTSTLPSSTLDKVGDTNKPLPVTTMAVTNTSSPTTAIPRTTVLSTAIAETQEKDTTAELPTLGTISTMSKPPDTHQSTVTQTHSQPAQVTSDVSMTLGTTPSATKFTNTGLVSSVSPNLRDTDRTVMTPSMTLVLSTPEHASPSSQTGTPTVPEKSTSTLPSSTLDKVDDTNKPLPVTTMAVTNTSSPTTAIPRTTVLSTATAETQEKDTTAEPPTLGTISTTSKPPDTHQSTVTQTHSQPAQVTSDVSMTLETTPSATKFTNTGLVSSVSPNLRDTDRTVMTPSTTLVLSTPEHASPSSQTGTPTVPEKSTSTLPSSTLDKVSDTNKPLPVTTMAVTNTSSPTTAIPRTTVLSIVIAETQEKDTTAEPPTLGTISTTSKPPDTHQSTVTQTHSQPAQTDSSLGTVTAQSPKPSTVFIYSSSDITKSSTIIGTSPASPNSTQSSGPGGGACALDEYLDSTGVCMCNDSYYSHLELSREIGTLHCRPQDIKVALRTCLLKTHHWVLKKDAFSSCSSINTTEQGRRVQVFQLMKKEGTCGLHISTNTSHALHSLDVHLEPAVPGSKNPDLGVLHFSCAYPLVVNVSQPVSYQEDSIPTIHTIHVPSTGETIITLSIFTNSELTTPLKNSTAPVGMTLYVVLKSTNSDPDRFVLVANEVFASSNPSNTVAKATYHFVKESCPVQGRLLQDLSNGASIHVILAFTLSRFLNSDMLYLHAQVTLCDKQASRLCQPSCSGKDPLRRNSPWNSRAGTRLEPGSSKWIVFGPLRISAPRASSSRSRAEAWMFILLLMAVGWLLD